MPTLPPSSPSQACPVTGTTPLLVHGDHFQHFDPTAPARTASSPTDRIMIGAAPCQFPVFLSATALECSGYPGFGNAHVVSVVAGGEGDATFAGPRQLPFPQAGDVTVSYADPCPKNAWGLVCNGRGQCQAQTQTCRCRTGASSGYWAGADCASCHAGYYGPVCNSSCPAEGTGVARRVCGGHGTCSDGVQGTGLCTCDTFGGVATHVPADRCLYLCPVGLGGIACSGPAQGTCYPAGGEARCTCNGGVGQWRAACDDCAAHAYGPDCARACDCSGHGTCSSGLQGDGACSCDHGYTGSRCQLLCPGVTTAVCGGHGDCGYAVGPGTETATCTCWRDAVRGFWNSSGVGVPCTVCVAEYRGSQAASCTLPCPVGPGGAVCSGHGQCWSGTCMCDDGFCGPVCSETGAATCAQYVCSGAQEGYWGPACNKTCPGYQPTSPVQVCARCSLYAVCVLRAPLLFCEHGPLKHRRIIIGVLNNTSE